MKRLLLDTHALLWWDEGTLPAALVRRIQRADDVYVSIATLWEIAIKAALGKLTVRGPLGDLIDDNGFALLPIEPHHLDEVRVLPHHHRDPFDRVLVAQARSERLILVSRDPALEAYGVETTWK